MFISFYCVYSFQDLWFKQMNEMRKSVAQPADEVPLIRQFCHSFEYLFGEDLSEGDDSDHESRPLLTKKTTTVSSSTSSVTRPINTTFSFSSDDPTVFKAKLSFVTTKDALGVLIDGSSDFLQSNVRMRSRILQKPEMWDRIVMQPCESLAQYESMIYQLFEFRVWYEYFSIGSDAGKPFVSFAHVKKIVPSSESVWIKKGAELTRMEQGGDEKKIPKKSKKQLLLAKIKADLKSAVPQDVLVTEDEEEEVLDVVEKPLEQPSSPIVVDADVSDSEWTQVGAPKVSRKSTMDITKVEEKDVKVDKKKILSRHLSEIPAVWSSVDSTTYICDTVVARMTRTFIHVHTKRSPQHQTQECPF